MCYIFALVLICCSYSITNAQGDYRLQVGHPSILRCETEEAETDGFIKWYHKNNEVKYSDNYVRNHTDHTLHIKSAVSEDAGVYTCQNGNNSNVTINLNASPYVADLVHVGNFEVGRPLELHCDAWGYPPPIIAWLKNNNELVNDSRITLSTITEEGENISNGTLSISNLYLNDTDTYMCVATDKNGAFHNATVSVTVIDPFAAVWPFLGIIVEVVILCAIILIYEYRHSKKMNGNDGNKELLDDKTREVSKNEEQTLEDKTVNSKLQLLGDDIEKTKI